MTQTHPETATDGQRDDAGGSRSSETITARPALKPTVLRLALVMLVGVTIIGYFFLDPTLLGSPAQTEIAANLVALLLLVAIGRQLFKLYVLRQTRYVVTPRSVKREYSLVYKKFSRELPLRKMRSHQLRRSRIEALFGIGSVAFLTGSVAQSPAFVEFENVPDPERLRRQVRERLPDDRS
jgi:hypothetical protein